MPPECCCSLPPSVIFPADFRDLYTKVLEEEAASVSSADTGQEGVGYQAGGRGALPCLLCTASPLSPPHCSFSFPPGLCSEACLFRLARCPSPKLLRARSAEKRRPVPTFQKVPLPSGPAPAHSLGDLKGSWPGRALVTRFLQMSRKAPDSTGTGAHGPTKQVSLPVVLKDLWESWKLQVGSDTCCPLLWLPCRCPGVPGAAQAARACTCAAVVISATAPPCGASSLAAGWSGALAPTA